MAKFRWTVPPSKGWSADRYIQALDRALGQLLDYYWAPRIEADARRSAPWTDRTGNARQTLYTKVIPALGEIVILLSHGMDYGIYLELKNAGRYAIISPAIDHFLPIIMADIQRAL